MRAGRLWCLSASVLVLWIATPVGAAENPPQRELPAGFDRTVHGDVAVIGNAVLGCPADDDPHETEFPARLCREAQARRGAGVSAQNNGHWMTWTDVDDDPATYNSSTAWLEIPAGAEVVHAELGWAGTTGRSSTAPCGRGGHPPGTPALQAPVLTAAGRSTALDPRRFAYTSDDPGSLEPTDQQFYSARADVTAELRGVETGRPVPVTAGNIWTPQGRDCFAGWSLTLVWAFDRAVPAAPAPRHVTLHGAHVRMPSHPHQESARLGSLRPAGGRARIGVIAYEGDWAQSGDRLLVEGRAQADPAGGGTENFFSSYALGHPDPVNNMSVDAKVVEVPATPGGTTAAITLTTRADAYLVQGFAVSTPLPELAVTIHPDRPAVHAGDVVEHTVRVANAGQAPARDLVARTGDETDCAPLPEELAGGASATVTCRTRAAADDHPVTVEVTGSSLAGDRLQATATTEVEVLRPGLRVYQSADPDTVVDGQDVAVDVHVENTGDTPLSGLRIDHDVLDRCDRADAGALDPGREVTVGCVVVAGLTDVTDTVTVTGTDQLGGVAAASATAGFSVVNPLLTMSAVWSADTVHAGEPVAITVRVGNPSRVAFDDVVVEGEPAACRRVVGELPAGGAFGYTCEVVPERSLATELTAVGTPRLKGATGQSVRRSASAPVRVTVLPAVGPATPGSPAAQVPAPAEPAARPQPPTQAREPARVPEPTPTRAPAGTAARVPVEMNPVVREEVYPARESAPPGKRVVALFAVAAGTAVMVVTASALAARRP